jgi:hypothetical protein
MKDKDQLITTEVIEYIDMYRQGLVTLSALIVVLLELDVTVQEFDGTEFTVMSTSDSSMSIDVWIDTQVDSVVVPTFKI